MGVRDLFQDILESLWQGHTAEQVAEMMQVPLEQVQEVVADALEETEIEND